MYALNFEFKDNISKPASFFSRQLKLKLGSSFDCDIQISDFDKLGFDLVVTKGIGREISINTVGDKASSDLARMFKGTYNGNAEIDTPELKCKILALDFDCYPSQVEDLQRESVNVFKKVVSKNRDAFPLLSFRINKSKTCYLSLNSINEITIGRGIAADVQVNVDDISSEHAKIEVLNNKYYISDLNSTNGTYLNSESVNGRSEFSEKDFIALGVSVLVRLVKNADQLLLEQSSQSVTNMPKLRRYPVVVTNSDLVQPKRIVLPNNKRLVVGREPDCDIWVGLPSVSREHCYLTYDSIGSITLKDNSKNGTFTNLVNLSQGLEHNISKRPEVIFFDNDVYLAICFTESQEELFNNSEGNIRGFLSNFGIKEAKKDAKTTSEKHVVKAKANNYMLFFAGIGFLCMLFIIGCLLWSLYV